MTEYDLVIDGSNVLLFGLTERNQDTFEVELMEFRKKMEYFRKMGYRFLFCFDRSTLDKIEKGKYKTKGEVEDLREIFDDFGAYFIQSDYEMAHFALEYSCPIVTNDQFRKWRDGSEKNKRSKVSIEEWNAIHEQSIGHKTDKSGYFTTLPPLQNRAPLFDDNSRADHLAIEVLELKSENEKLRRQKELQIATIASLRNMLKVAVKED